MESIRKELRKRISEEYYDKDWYNGFKNRFSVSFDQFQTSALRNYR